MNIDDSEEVISRVWQESHLKHFFGIQGIAVSSGANGPKLVHERRKSAVAVGGSKQGRRKLLEDAKSLFVAQS